MNKSVAAIAESINVELANSIRQLESTGEKITKMQTGDPDFATPEFICLAAQAAMNNGDTHYCASNGQLALRTALKNKLITKNNLTCVDESNILITHGAVHGVYVVMQTLINPQDEVIIISPYWMPYASNIELAGAKPVIVESKMSDGFIPQIAEIIAATTNKTKAIIINSPNNPTGCVYDQSSLQLIADHCVKHDIYLISDEVYEDIIYGSYVGNGDKDNHYQRQHISVQTLVPDYKKVVTLFSFSKSYAMTGWRIGYLVANTALIAQMNKLSQYITTSINSFVQAGALAAIENEQSPHALTHMLEIYAKRRAIIKDIIKGTWLEAATVFPEGTFYVFIDISQFELDSMTFVQQLIKHKKVAFTPGIAFGDNCNHYIRMTFASNETAIKCALTHLVTLKKEDFTLNEVGEV